MFRFTPRLIGTRDTLLGIGGAGGAVLEIGVALVANLGIEGALGASLGIGGAGGASRHLGPNRCPSPSLVDWNFWGRMCTSGASDRSGRNPTAAIVNPPPIIEINHISRGPKFDPTRPKLIRIHKSKGWAPPE